MALGRVDDDAVVGDRHRLRGPSTQSIPAALSCSWSSGFRLQRLVGRDQGDVGGEAAQEHRLGDAVAVAADHADLLVGDLIAVADRAIADQPARQRLVVQLLVHRRAAVGDAGGEQHGARLAEPEPQVAQKPLVVRSSRVTNSCSIGAPYLLRLLAHPPDQFLARDPVGKAGMVARARDPRGAALAAIDHQDVEMEAREIDRGGQPGGAAADDQAVEMVQPFVAQWIAATTVPD